MEIPNEETIKAMRAADKRRTRKAKSVDELFGNLA
jgi:hypothetical protein